MSEDPQPDPEAERKARRSKLFGRLLIIALALLLLAQMVPYAMSFYGRS